MRRWYLNALIVVAAASGCAPTGDPAIGGPEGVAAANETQSSTTESSDDRENHHEDEDGGTGNRYTQEVVAQGSNASEVSVAVNAGSGSVPARRAVFFNDSGGPTVMGWSYAPATSSSYTWCNAGFASCTTSGNPATILAPSSYYQPQVQWRGDPIVLAGPPGQMVFVSMGSSTTTGGVDMIVASFSNDNGARLTSSIQVSDRYTPYAEDQPTAAWDSTSNVICVGWRHRGGLLDMYHPVVRCGRLNVPSTNSVSWVTNGNDVPNGTPFLQEFAGMSVQVYTYAGTPYLDVMYEAPDWNPNVACPMGARGVSWYYAEAAIGTSALTWVVGPVRIATSNSYNPCVVNNQLEEGFRNFAFTWDNLGTSGHLWAAMRNPSGNGIDVWTSVGGAGAWTKVQTVYASGAVSYLMPNLAARPNGDVELDFYASNSSDTQVNRFLSTHYAAWAPSAWDVPVMAGAWFTPVNGFGIRQLGDYEGLTAFPSGVSGTFLSAYSEVRPGPTIGVVTY